MRGSSQRAPLLSDTGHCRPRTFPWTPRSFSGCRAGDEAFPLQQSVQELLSVALPLPQWQQVTVLCPALEQQ